LNAQPFGLNTQKKKYSIGARLAFSVGRVLAEMKEVEEILGSGFAVNKSL
jgi:hypothetical protein